MEKQYRPRFKTVRAELDRPGLEALLPKRPLDPWERIVFVRGPRVGEVLMGGPADMSDIDLLIDRELKRRKGTLFVIIVCRVGEMDCFTRIDYEEGKASAPYSAFFEPDQSCICQG